MASAAFDNSLQRLDAPHQRAFSFFGHTPGTGHRHAPVGHRRYQQHDLLRDYARLCAETHVRADERSVALARLTAWYGLALTLVEYLLDAEGTAISARPVADGSELDAAGQAEEWVASEKDNLLALAEHASGRTGAIICSRYGHWLDRLYRHAPAAVLYSSAARLYREIGDRVGEAGALLALGQIERIMREFSAADEHLKVALDLHRRTGNQQGEADALGGLGRVSVETGSYASADEDLQAALKLYRSSV